MPTFEDLTTAARDAVRRIGAGVCLGCGWVNATTAGVSAMRCEGPKCGQPVRLTYVRGTHSAAPCDDQCQYAAGDDCECSCGGANHRVGYISPGVPVWVRDRDAARHLAKQQRKDAAQARARRTADEARAALLADFPELAALNSPRYADSFDGFAFDMRAALNSGRMTDRQRDAALNMIRRDRERDARTAAREAERDQVRASGVAVPAGRVTFTGTIVRVKVDEGETSWNRGTVTRMCVRHADGWEVWGTVPAEIVKAALYGPLYDEACARDLMPRTRVLEGHAVTLTATLAPGTRDVLVGGYKRPSGAVLDPATPAATVVDDRPRKTTRERRCRFHGPDTICPDCRPDEMRQINAGRDAVAASWDAHDERQRAETTAQPADPWSAALAALPTD